MAVTQSTSAGTHCTNLSYSDTLYVTMQVWIQEFLTGGDELEINVLVRGPCYLCRPLWGSRGSPLAGTHWTGPLKAPGLSTSYFSQIAYPGTLI